MRKPFRARSFASRGALVAKYVDNGGANWDNEFRKMLDALQRYLSMGMALEPKILREVTSLLKQIRNGNGEPARLTELSVHWVLSNPAPLPLPEPDYKR